MFTQHLWQHSHQRIHGHIGVEGLGHFVQVILAAVGQSILRRANLRIQHGFVGEGWHDDAARGIEQRGEQVIRVHRTEGTQRCVCNDKVFANA